MKQLVYLAALTMIPVVVFAQKSFDDDVNSELDKMYDQNRTVQTPAIAQQAPPQAQPQIVVQQVQPQSVQQSPPVQQLQPMAVQAPVVAPVAAPQVVQKQATTTIEASPLTESRAEKMRKAREEAELQTEQKIVEKLETSRMEDEKRRSEVLFGDKFNQLSTPAPVAAPAPVAVAAAPAPAPTPVVVTEQTVAPPQVKEEKLSREDVHSEITAALDEAKAKEEAKKSERKTYVSLLGGMDQYNNTNIQSQYSLGVGVGQRINDRFLVEGQFNYADAHIQQLNSGVYGYGGYGSYYPRITDMVSYQGVVQAKYEFFSGTFRPLIGAAAAYTYRKYNDIQFGSSNNTGSSNSIDLGLVAGVDVAMSESLSLGFEAMYLWNVANQTQADNSLTPAYSNNAQTPENMGNLNLSVVGRMSF